MTKKVDNDEIDIIDTFLILWENKFKVILILIVTLIFTFSYQLIIKTKTEPKVTITSEIQPITVYDEAKYKIYNSFLSTLKPNYLRIIEPNQQENIVLIEKNTGKTVTSFEMKEGGLVVNNINKQFLFDLFIDKFKQKSHLTKTIKSYNFINRDDYSNDLDYENAIFKMVSSIKILNKKNNVIQDDNIYSYIQVETTNIERWETFLKFIEQETNIAIQSDLSEMVSNYLDFSQKLKEFTLEDIDIKIMTSSTDEEIIKLKKMRKSLEAEKYNERMKNVYESSPIADSNSFYAAKIDYDSNNYKIKQNNELSIKKILLIASIFGLIFGILFVLIGNAIKNRT